MDEKDIIIQPETKLEPVTTCKCPSEVPSSQKIEITPRKQRALTVVTKTESYLRERRIPELIRFLMTKVISDADEKPVAYLEKLLDDCMLFRAGHGQPPVLFEQCHIEAVLKSFDPGQRGWFSAGQMKRIFVTLGLSSEETFEEKVPYDTALEKIIKTQENELFDLLTAGSIYEGDYFVDHNVTKDYYSYQMQNYIGR